MAFENDGTFDEEMFRAQLPGIVARITGDEHVTHCANKTITVKADGTYTVAPRIDADPDEVTPAGVPETHQLPPAPHHGPREFARPALRSGAPNAKSWPHPAQEGA